MKHLEKASAFQMALAKTHLAANGIPYKELDKPIIGVVNSWNEIVSGHVPLREVATDVKAGIAAGGGLPLEFNTIAICDGIAQGTAGMRYPLASRELIADSIEAMVLGHGIFDGLVFITACDKITPGMLMAAARLNLPSIVVTSGPMNTCAPLAGRKELRKRFLNGEIGEQELVEGSLEFYPGPGVCPFYGTANSMLVAAEALGMSLSGSAMIPQGTARRRVSVQAAGERVVELVRDRIDPARIMTRQAFLNAMRVLVATGGSLNTLLHLPAIAAELGIEVTWDDFDRISREVPLLSALYPNGPYNAVDFGNAGGVPALMKTIEKYLDTEVITVDRRPLAVLVDEARVKDSEVIRPLENPVNPEGGIAVLYGNLAPEGAIVKQSAVSREMLKFQGPALVFDDEEDCIRAIEEGRVRDGSVLVIRYEGPQGGPGMREMHRVTEESGRLKKVASVTDGRFSGASAGLAVGYLSPEAYAGGPLALVADGDQIRIDVPGRKIELLVPEAQLAARRASWRRVEKGTNSRFLDLYRRTTGPASNGARRRGVE